MVETRVVYLSVGEITLKTITLPPVKPNQVMIKAHQASVCGSERYFYRGINVRPQDEARGMKWDPSKTKAHREHAYPMGPLGHEGGGTIVEMGSAVKEYLGGGRVEVGDRVGSLKYPTYTDYWIADIAQVQPIPEGVSFEVGCLYEPLGCASWAAIHIGVKPGDTVAVNGVGFPGNIILQGVLKAGASMVVAVDVSKRKLEIAKSMGANYTINPLEEDAVARVNELTDEEGVDVAVDAVGGTGIGIVQSLGMVAHNGLLDLYGDNYAPINEFCFHRFHEDAIEVRSLSPVHFTGLRSVENMREAYRAIQRGVFDLDVILNNSERYRLDDIAEIFTNEAEALDEQSSLKTLVLP